MKVKIVLLVLICSFLGILINKQDTLIRVPKDERDLIKVSSEVITGKISHINDGDSFVLNNNIKIRLFGIDAPELVQTCMLVAENQEKSNNENNTTNTVELKQTNDNQKNMFSGLIKKDNNEGISNSINGEEIKCGENAKNKLTELTKDQIVSCIIKGKDSYGRMVGECYFEIQNRRTKKANRVNINKEMVLSGNAIAFLQFTDKYVDDENKAKQENRGIWATSFDLPSVYRKKNAK
ncbi:MAG: thermonuclease family protein [Rickettsiales bacterium]|nr:thermonuclease family protein [Rickettsiales bacterium]